MESKSVESSKFDMIRCSRGIPFVPDEIIFNILVLLPAEVLHNVMRYVCRRWRRIIEGPQFVNTHLLSSTTTLLMYCPKTEFYHLWDVSDECHAKLTGLELDLCSSFMNSTCNGLILIQGRSSPSPLASVTYCVANPITRRMLPLPSLFLPSCIIYCGLAFEPSSKVYKVVVVYETQKYSDEPLHLDFNIDFGCTILTVGVDKAWRVINCAHLEKDDMTLLTLGPPITSTEFVYWVSRNNPFILALDLKSESIKRVAVPSAYRWSYFIDYLPKGNSISLWHSSSDCSIEVWLLNDHISEEWVKFLHIDGEPLRNELCNVLSVNELTPRKIECSRIVPRSWLGNGEKILFRSVWNNGPLFVYDLKTRSCFRFALGNDESCLASELVPFVKSLAWVC